MDICSLHSYLKPTTPYFLIIHRGTTLKITVSKYLDTHTNETNSIFKESFLNQNISYRGPP